MQARSFLPMLTAVALAATACQAGDPADVASPNGGTPLFAVAGAADFEEFEICKYGATATFDYSVTDRTTSTTTTGQVVLDDGECFVVARAGGAGADVTVTETVPAGFLLDRVEIGVVTAGPTLATRTEPGPTVTDFIAGGAVGVRGVLAEFYNVAEPPPLSSGRMTGGGRQILVGGIAISRGFTVHCDITLSNNIEINWEGHRWHLDKPIDTAQCFDDPAINQNPPKASLDTFIGTATGRLNGVAGSALEFTFIDAGEPGRNDMAALKIWDAGGTLVLDVPLSHLVNGNIQAHDDQPHK